MSYFVYVIQSLKDHKFYIGSTADVKARLIFHNKGLQRSTRNRIPFRLVYVEELENMKSALIREKQIKSYKGGSAFYKLFDSGSSPASGGALVWGASGCPRH